MMGVRVREKRPGEVFVFVHFRNERTSQKVGTYKNSSEKVRVYKRAERLKLEIEDEIKLGRFNTEKPNAPLLRNFYESFRDEYCRSSVRPSTRKSYIKHFRVHILPALGNLPMNEITRQTVKHFAQKLVAHNLAKNTVRNCLAALRVCFSEAVEAEDIPIEINPVRGIRKLIRMARKPKENDPWTPEEAEKFLVEAATEAPNYFALFLTALNTGMRSGELAGLQWADIDFPSKTIRVRRQFSAGKVADLKTDESKRRIDMSEALCEELTNLHRVQNVSWRNRKLQAPVWVFPNAAGNPMDMQNVKHRHFNRCITAANVRRIRFHDLRHTFASILLAHGESLEYLRDQLGHTSIKTTADIYCHLIPGANRKAVNKLPKINRETSSLKVVK